MKAHTKYRCLCPKPSAFAQMMVTGEYNSKLHDNILHWSTATTECSRCWIPLCSNCGIEINRWILAGDYGVFKSIDPPKTLCPACVEEMR